MELSLDQNTVKFSIQSYTVGKASGDGTTSTSGCKVGCITVNHQPYFEAILITPEQLISPWGPPLLADLTHEHFQDLLQYKPELVILGTGEKLIFPPKALYDILTKQKIGVEIMNTRSACRTYTLLASENRKVVAGLYP